MEETTSRFLLLETWVVGITTSKGLNVNVHILYDNTSKEVKGSLNAVIRFMIYSWNFKVKSFFAHVILVRI